MQSHLLTFCARARLHMYSIRKLFEHRIFVKFCTRHCYLFLHGAPETSGSLNDIGVRYHS